MKDTSCRPCRHRDGPLVYQHLTGRTTLHLVLTLQVPPSTDRHSLGARDQTGYDVLLRHPDSRWSGAARQQRMLLGCLLLLSSRGVSQSSESSRLRPNRIPATLLQYTDQQTAAAAVGGTILTIRPPVHPLHRPSDVLGPNRRVLPLRCSTFLKRWESRPHHSPIRHLHPPKTRQLLRLGGFQDRRRLCRPTCSVMLLRGLSRRHQDR